MQTTQLSAMIRYEMLMQWRRRGVLMTLIVLLIFVVGLTLLLTQGGVNMETRVRAALAPFNDELHVNTTLVLYTLMIVMMAFSVTVPVMTAETVPVDHQYRVTDLLNSLPINRTTYLLGKLLGVWLTLTLGVAVCAVICCVLMWLMLGEYDIVAYLLMWALYVVPLVLFTSALGVLLASTQPSRRRGVLLVAPLSLYPYVVVVVSMSSAWSLMRLLRPQTVSEMGSIDIVSGSSIAEFYGFMLLNIVGLLGAGVAVAALA